MLSSVASVHHFIPFIVSLPSALCNPVCQNNGTCISPEICACPSGYHGKLCEKGKELTLARGHCTKSLLSASYNNRSIQTQHCQQSKQRVLRWSHNSPRAVSKKYMSSIHLHESSQNHVTESWDGGNEDSFIPTLPRPQTCRL